MAKLRVSTLPCSLIKSSHPNGSSHGWLRIADDLPSHSLIIGEQAKRVRHYLRGVQIRAGMVYTYICVHEGTCAVIVAHATYM